MTIERPMFPPRADSVDSLSHQPVTGQPEAAKRASESRKPSEGLSRRGIIGALAALPVAMPAAAAPPSDAELVALGLKFEPLVDRYYAARAVWSDAMVRTHAEHNNQFGERYDWPRSPEVQAAWDQTCDRYSLDEASASCGAIWDEMEPLADAINALPVSSIEGLRAKALVALWAAAPISAGDTTYSFDDAIPSQNLFCAVAQFCGLTRKVERIGFAMPVVDEADDEDEG